MDFIELLALLVQSFDEIWKSVHIIYTVFLLSTCPSTSGTLKYDRLFYITQCFTEVLSFFFFLCFILNLLDCYAFNFSGVLFSCIQSALIPSVFSTFYILCLISRSFRWLLSLSSVVNRIMALRDPRPLFLHSSRYLVR